MRVNPSSTTSQTETPVKPEITAQLSTSVEAKVEPSSATSSALTKKYRSFELMAVHLRRIANAEITTKAVILEGVKIMGIGTFVATWMLPLRFWQQWIQSKSIPANTQKMAGGKTINNLGSKSFYRDLPLGAALVLAQNLASIWTKAGQAASTKTFFQTQRTGFEKGAVEKINNENRHSSDSSEQLNQNSNMQLPLSFTVTLSGLLASAETLATQKWVNEQAWKCQSSLATLEGRIFEIPKPQNRQQRYQTYTAGLTPRFMSNTLNILGLMLLPSIEISLTANGIPTKSAEWAAPCIAALLMSGPSTTLGLLNRAQVLAIGPAPQFQCPSLAEVTRGIIHQGGYRALFSGQLATLLSMTAIYYLVPWGESLINGKMPQIERTYDRLASSTSRICTSFINAVSRNEETQVTSAMKTTPTPEITSVPNLPLQQPARKINPALYSPLEHFRQQLQSQAKTPGATQPKQPTRAPKMIDSPFNLWRAQLKSASPSQRTSNAKRLVSETTRGP